MGLVMKVCEKLLVLEYGSLIADGLPEVVRRDPEGHCRPISGRTIETFLPE